MKNSGIFFKATEREKRKIKTNAKLCNLNQGEYILQRALGYAPKAVLPDVFFLFCEKLDRLTKPPFSSEVNKSALKVLAEISAELLLPSKEEIAKWQPPDSGPSEDD